jgi:hypothetical protein
LIRGRELDLIDRAHGAHTASPVGRLRTARHAGLVAERALSDPRAALADGVRGAARVRDRADRALRAALLADAAEAQIEAARRRASGCDGVAERRRRPLDRSRCVGARARRRACAAAAVVALDERHLSPTPERGDEDDEAAHGRTTSVDHGATISRFAPIACKQRDPEGGSLNRPHPWPSVIDPDARAAPTLTRIDTQTIEDP